jgi:hypothetical protein
MFYLGCRGERVKKGENFGPVLEIPASEFTDNERMTDHITVIQQYLKPSISFQQMCHPH